MEAIWRHGKCVGSFLYLVNPKDYSHEHAEDVPDYIFQTCPYVVILILLEQCVLVVKKKKVPVSDSVTSFSQVIIMELVRLLLKTFLLTSYVWCYNTFHVIEMPWHSVWTWLCGVVFVDLAFYWLHRICHEVNVFWAAHQVHHSSEEYNLTTALRLSWIQPYITWVFYLPLALFLPPSVLLVHVQLNPIYQIWIHTELIGKIGGPIEYIFNTPSHHRVHHGRNRKYIDKNYGGFLIIWDRMFGTFEPEDETVVYGLTHPLNSFSPLQIQMGHYIYIWKRFWKLEGIENKLSLLFKGPGWGPGKPRLGSIDDIPDVHADDYIKKYRPKLPLWCNVYVLIHISIIGVLVIEVYDVSKNLPTLPLLIAISYLMFSIHVIGLLLDKMRNFVVLEEVRCILFLMIDSYVVQFQWGSAVKFALFTSMILWGVQMTRLPEKQLEFINGEISLERTVREKRRTISKS